MNQITLSHHTDFCWFLQKSLHESRFWHSHSPHICDASLNACLVPSRLRPSKPQSNKAFPCPQSLVSVCPTFHYGFTGMIPSVVFAVYNAVALLELALPQNNPCKVDGNVISACFSIQHKYMFESNCGHFLVIRRTASCHVYFHVVPTGFFCSRRYFPVIYLLPVVCWPVFYAK